jgi:hypothetical protein
MQSSANSRRFFKEKVDPFLPVGRKGIISGVYGKLRDSGYMTFKVTVVCLSIFGKLIYGMNASFLTM